MQPQQMHKQNAHKTMLFTLNISSLNHLFSFFDIPFSASIELLPMLLPLFLQPLPLGLHLHDKRALHANPVSILPKDKRDRDKRSLKQPEKRAGPIRSHIRVHGLASNGHHATENASNDGISRQCRCRELLVAACQVVGGIDEDARVPGTKEGAHDDGRDPMDGFRGAGPCKGQFTKGNEDGGDADNRHHCFRWRFARYRVRIMRADHAPDERLTEDGHHDASSDS